MEGGLVAASRAEGQREVVMAPASVGSEAEAARAPVRVVANLEASLVAAAMEAAALKAAAQVGTLVAAVREVESR